MVDETVRLISVVENKSRFTQLKNDRLVLGLFETDSTDFG